MRWSLKRAQSIGWGLVLAGCTQVTFCEPVQVEQVAIYFRGWLVRAPDLDVDEPYCVLVDEEEVSEGVVRKTFRCVVCQGE